MKKTLQWLVLMCFVINMGCTENKKPEQQKVLQKVNKIGDVLSHIGVNNFSQYEHIFFFTDGCSGCRSKFLFEIVDNKWYDKNLIVVGMPNVKMLDGFVHQNIVVDSANYLASHQVTFLTDGYLTINGSDTVITHINVNNSDSLINYFTKKYKDHK